MRVLTPSKGSHSKSGAFIAGVEGSLTCFAPSEPWVAVAADAALSFSPAIAAEVTDETRKPVARNAARAELLEFFEIRTADTY